MRQQRPCGRFGHTRHSGQRSRAFPRPQEVSAQQITLLVGDSMLRLSGFSNCRLVVCARQLDKGQSA